MESYNLEEQEFLFYCWIGVSFKKFRSKKLGGFISQSWGGIVGFWEQDFCGFDSV